MTIMSINLSVYIYIPPITLAIKYFLSECIVCQNLVSASMSSRNSEPR